MASKTWAPRVPEAHEIHDGEVVLQFESSPNDQGVAYFAASWLDDNKPGGVAAQMFRTNLVEFVERELWRDRVHSVVGLDDRDAEILRRALGEDEPKYRDPTYGWRTDERA